MGKVRSYRQTFSWSWITAGFCHRQTLLCCLRTETHTHARTHARSKHARTRARARTHTHTHTHTHARTPARAHTHCYSSKCCLKRWEFCDWTLFERGLIIKVQWTAQGELGTSESEKTPDMGSTDRINIYM